MFFYQYITIGGGGEVFECSPLEPELLARANGQKLVAKKIVATQSTFIQEVSIMGLFVTHPHFVKTKLVHS